MFDAVRTMQIYTNQKYIAEEEPEPIEEPASKYENIEDLLQTYKQPYREEQDKKKKKEVLKQFRQELAPMLVDEYKWPHLVAKTVSKFAYPANGESKKSITDYLLAFELGGLPERYVHPLSKIMKVDREFITSNHIKLDWAATALTGVLAYTIPDLGENISTALTNMAPALGETLKYIGYVSSALLSVNVMIKPIQLPYRTWMHMKHNEHTAAPAGIFDANIPNAILNGTLFMHDWKEKLKDYMTKDSNNIDREPYEKTSQLMEPMINFYRD